MHAVFVVEVAAVVDARPLHHQEEAVRVGGQVLQRRGGHLGEGRGVTQAIVDVGERIVGEQPEQRTFARGGEARGVGDVRRVAEEGGEVERAAAEQDVGAIGRAHV